MKCHHFYHVWAGGRWQEPLREHHAALTAAGFTGRISLGIVGPPLDRADVLRDWPCPSYTTADTGHESVTINRVRQYAQHNDGAVLYAHTKGAADNTAFRARWRRSMTARVVGRWRENLDPLESGDVDAVGCHWLTEAAFPGMFGPQTIPAPGSGFFGGNFWMARCDYLRTLPECPPEPRWEAESWIGHGSPRVVDLLPGWPDDRRWPELCE